MHKKGKYFQYICAELKKEKQCEWKMQLQQQQQQHQRQRLKPFLIYFSSPVDVAQRLPTSHIRTIGPGVCPGVFFMATAAAALLPFPKPAFSSPCPSMVAISAPIYAP